MKKVKIRENRGSYLDSRWRKVRLLVFKRDNNSCLECGSTEKLHCHHNYYKTNHKLWEYPLSCFKTLCESCHSEFHKKIKGTALVRKVKTKNKRPKKIKAELALDKPETIQQRRNRLVVPQWKIDEYRSLNKV